MGYLVIPSGANNSLTNAVFFPSANTGTQLTGLINGTSYSVYSVTAGPVVTPQAAQQLIANTVTNPSMSITLGPLRIQGPRTFINQFKLASTWSGSITGGGNRSHAQLLADGNINARGQVISVPAGLDNIVCYNLNILNENTGGTGRWRLTWEGTGDVVVFHAQNTTPGPAGSNRIDFDYTANGSNLIAVGVRSVTAGPIRNFKLVHHEDLADDAAGMIFKRNWLEQIRNYRTIRFDNWHNINLANVTTASSRPHPDDWSYADGVPLEVMADLCNVTGSDGWFCISHMALNDYVTQAATILRDRLDPKRHCYIEYSNKCWDFATPQANWCRSRGDEMFGDTDATNFMQYYGGRSAEIAQIARNVWGATPRLHTVIQSQCDWLGLEEHVLNAPKWRALSPSTRNAPYTYFTDYTVHAQIDGGLAYGENSSTVDTWRTTLTQTEAFNRIRDQQLDGRWITLSDPRTVSNLTRKWQYHKDIANARNLGFITYDGGSHFHFGGTYRDNAAFVAFVHEYHYSTQFATVVEALVNAFLGAGGQLFSFSVDSKIPDRDTTTGLQRHVTDVNPAWTYYTTRNRTVAGPTGRGPFDFVGTYETTTGTAPEPEPQPQPTDHHAVTSIVNFTGDSSTYDALRIPNNNAFGNLVPMPATSVSNIVNNNGNNTGMSLSMSFTGNPVLGPNAPGRGANSNGYVVGLPEYSGQLLSRQVVGCSTYMTTGVTLQIALTNLTAGRSYRLGFVASRETAEVRNTVITATGGPSVTINSSATTIAVSEMTVTANAQGRIDLVVAPQSGTSFAYINGMSIRGL